MATAWTDLRAEADAWCLLDLMGHNTPIHSNLSCAQEARPGSKWSEYRLYGLTLSSDYPFVSRLAPGSGPPDLTFTCAARTPVSGGQQHTPAAYASPRCTDDGESIGLLYRLESCDLLRVTDMFDYYIWANRIIGHLVDPVWRHMLEIHLLGTVLSYWLERRGIPALHASAAVVHGRATAFLSHSSGGKSVLAAAFIQEGHPLLTDDILPVEHCGGTFVGRPGYPEMRLWPHECQHFLAYHKDLERVHPGLSKRRVRVGADGFGTFCDACRPLACIYLPQRRPPTEGETGVEISAISPRDGVIELVRHSFTPGVVEAIGLQPQRLDLFASLVQQVPMRRLVYPSGFDYLPLVREAILRDVEAVS